MASGLLSSVKLLILRLAARPRSLFFEQVLKTIRL